MNSFGLTMECTETVIYRHYEKNYAVTGPDIFCPEIITCSTTDLAGLWNWMIRECSSDADIPYWAVVWPGGRAMARFIMDNSIFRGKQVLDFAAGSGIASIALLKSGASPVALDLDPLAAFAARKMADLNHVHYTYITDDILNSEEKLIRLNQEFDSVICSDVFYEKTLAFEVIRAFSYLRIPVYFADPGRMHVPEEKLEKIMSYRVPVHPEIENVRFRDAAIYRLKYE